MHETIELSRSYTFEDASNKKLKQHSLKQIFNERLRWREYFLELELIKWKSHLWNALSLSFSNIPFYEQKWRKNSKATKLAFFLGFATNKPIILQHK